MATATVQASTVSRYTLRRAANHLTAPSPLTVSEWAEANIVLDVSQEPGKLRLSRTPYLRRILDAFGDPRVKKITLMTASQVAKTTALMCMLAYAIAESPGDCLFVLPTEDLCRNFSKGRLGKLFKRTAAVQSKLTGVGGDQSMFRYAFSNMTMYMGWANSPAMLSSNPVRYVFMDEVGKFPAFSGNEADPTKLATERCKNFWNRKVVQVSTPTKAGDYIAREFKAGSQEYFHVPCQYCGVRQTMVFSQIKRPSGVWDADMIRSERLAWYECAACGGEIRDHHKRRMLMDGEWIATTENREHVSVSLSSIASPWLTFSDVMGEFVECYRRPELLMNFTNSWLGESWTEKAEEVTTNSVEKLRGNYTSGVVPSDVYCLVGGADVQKDGVYWEVRAFGYGDEGLPSWLIDYGFIKRPNDRSNKDLEDLNDAVLLKVYPGLAVNKTWSISVLFVDSGYRTNEVYAFARKYGERVRATKGASVKPQTPVSFSRIDRDRRGRVLKWSQLVGLIDTEYFKDMIHARRTCQPPLWHMPANVGSNYIAQVSAEHKVIERDTKGRAKESWQIRPDAGDNHWWDTDVLTFAGAYHLGVHLKKAVKQGPVVSSAKTDGGGGKRGFVARRPVSSGRGKGFVSRR